MASLPIDYATEWRHRCRSCKWFNVEKKPFYASMRYECSSPLPEWVTLETTEIDSWVYPFGGTDCDMYKESDEQQSKVQGDGAGDT